jgi:hypothetical protein
VRYLRAIESLQLEPLHPGDASITAFVKAEKVNFTDKVDPAPRLIQPRGPRYNVMVGVYIKNIEHTLYRGIDRLFGEPTVAKGMNASTRGRRLWEKWSTFTRPVAVLLDASRFDQSVSPAALRWEHSIYLWMYNNDPDLARYLSWQVVNRGKARTHDGTLRYSVNGCRMSGDMNTACGNVLLMCMMMWSFFDALGVRASLFNDGDDCVVIVEERDAARVREGVAGFFEPLGFRMTDEGQVEVFEQICFCQSNPIWDGTGYRMVRHPRTSLSKDLVSTKTM